MGRFGVEAINPEDGYVAFAGTSLKEIVTLTPSQSSATVALKLSPKSHSGGQTITQGIKRTKFHQKCFLLTISASGYKKWIYHDPSDPSRREGTARRYSSRKLLRRQSIVNITSALHIRIALLDA